MNNDKAILRLIQNSKDIESLENHECSFLIHNGVCLSRSRRFEMRISSFYLVLNYVQMLCNFSKIGMSRVHNTLLVLSLKECFNATLNSY